MLSEIKKCDLLQKLPMYMYGPTLASDGPLQMDRDQILEVQSSILTCTSIISNEEINKFHKFTLGIRPTKITSPGSLTEQFDTGMGH